MKHPPELGQVGTSGGEFSRRWRGSAPTSRVSAASYNRNGLPTEASESRRPFGESDAIARGIHGSAGQLGAHNPENTVNVIYTAGPSVGYRRDDDDDRDGTATGFFPLRIVPSSLIFEAYSLFYRSRKDVRQLKDSFDLLCGRMARRCDGSRMMVGDMRSAHEWVVHVR